MLQRTLILVLLFMFSLSGSVFAQQCDVGQRSLSTPTENYFLNDDGTITDLDSGLTWQRCAAGQQWNGNNCVGQALMLTWHEAFSFEDEFNRQVQFRQKWRVPRLAELAGIVERQCINPRINLQIFPRTPADVFWTASSRKGHPGEAFALSFANQGVVSATQTQRYYLRLVSGREE